MRKANRGSLRDRGRCGCELREDGTLFPVGGRDGMERERDHGPRGVGVGHRKENTSKRRESVIWGFFPKL